MQFLKDFYEDTYGKYFYNFSIENYDINKIIKILVNKVDLTYYKNIEEFNYYDFYEIWKYAFEIDEITQYHMLLLYYLTKKIKIDEDEIKIHEIFNFQIIDFLVANLSTKDKFKFEIGIAAIALFSIKFNILNHLKTIDVFQYISTCSNYFPNDFEIFKSLCSMFSSFIKISDEKYFIHNCIDFIDTFSYLIYNEDIRFSKIIYKLMEILILFHPKNNYSNFIIKYIFAVLNNNLIRTNAIKILFIFYENDILLANHITLINENINQIVENANISSQKLFFIKLFKKIAKNSQTNKEIKQYINDNFIILSFDTIINNGTFNDNISFLKLLVLNINFLRPEFCAL